MKIVILKIHPPCSLWAASALLSICIFSASSTRATAQTAQTALLEAAAITPPASTPAPAHSDASLPDAPLPEFQQPTTPAASPQSPSASKPNGSTAQDGSSKCHILPCPRHMIDWYQRFITGPAPKPLTPAEKAWLGLRGLLDPFNAITILGEGAISVGADSHSPYGPGMPGFGKYVGVSYTEDLTGEFFGTFLIPSIVHQDPRYHRMPKASYPRRITHAITQVIWTQSDYNKGMLNYANLVGFAIEDEIGNLYVPGRQTNAGATAQRYVIGLATAPISNLISEFLPDVARHIHVQVFVVQRIVNHIATSGNNQ